MAIIRFYLFSNPCGRQIRQNCHQKTESSFSEDAGHHSDRSVHSDEVIPCDPKGHTRLVIRQLAAVRIRPANVAAR